MAQASGPAEARATRAPVAPSRADAVLDVCLAEAAAASTMSRTGSDAHAAIATCWATCPSQVSGGETSSAASAA